MRRKPALYYLKSDTGRLKQPLFWENILHRKKEKENIYH